MLTVIVNWAGERTRVYNNLNQPQANALITTISNMREKAEQHAIETGRAIPEPDVRIEVRA